MNDLIDVVGTINSGKCMECGKQFVGRSDKKFCCDMCRNSYNNRLRNRRDREVIRINNILSRNRRILAKLCKTPKSTLPVSVLRENYFNFKYCTSVSRKATGRTIYCCYDYAYYITLSGIAHISLNR
ncbi:MAG: hypothetical protein PHD07_01370 [Bacteroidales bacterium]|nr:hypothetical protein [Bacteroidales bacterium]MDD3200780.1 hypothetical protein [Bacteroidales bacterium]